MKKKILFLIGNMESGGVSKSMSSLLNVIDTQKYDVDCFVLDPQGIFMPSIPSSIHLIKDERTALMTRSFSKSFWGLLKKGYFLDGIIRFIAAFFMLFNKGIGAWLISRRIINLPKTYDLAVDYNGQLQLYYLIDKVKARKKVTFFHSDYTKWGYYYNMDRKYFPKVDYIFTISNICVQSLIKYFPLEKEKISVFENILNKDVIAQLAEESIEEVLPNENILTIGHLSALKGTLLALDSAEILMQRGLNFSWYFLGKNTMDHNYEEIIKQKNLQTKIVLLGIKSNPYPYIKKSTIIVHPSQFEGKSIALDEAKILAKPIVVTNFSTVRDQFENGVNATICDMEKEALADSIEELLLNDGLRSRYSKNLVAGNYDNTSEINKLYQLIDGING